ncbi:DUF2325 domain-containing protein [Crassaminicella thermophila]|uniref:DUF2325 domain-containing protein n=1 Tax=Crassaminicella thermophila TaxID=2599308 RepID=A0A5C0SG49_CRATE|nr:DUF2325 domain-containing protein [Crassaminicella thermophila]QEK13331.1 DUF2325 domain-containing protein [Crassaminicella thermophila]
MTALIVGGDRLGNIPQVLNERGIDQYIHWAGRKKGMRNKVVPTNIDMIIVLYDFIEHNLANIIKKESKTMDVPCIFAKRAVSDLAMKLDVCKYCTKDCEYKKKKHISY